MYRNVMLETASRNVFTVDTSSSAGNPCHARLVHILWLQACFKRKDYHVSIIPL